MIAVLLSPLRCQILEGGAANAAAAAADGPGGAGNAPPPLDGPGTYTLFAVISHIGKSTDHGHYVAHIKKDGQWAFFNDEKVCLVA
jgi:ubiquitin carboxyl-terminal hydrolase 5/13